MSRKARALPPRGWCSGIVISLWLAIPPFAAAQAQIRFVDVSAAAGIDGDTYSSSTQHSLGVNWIDFDDDGWPDLFAVGGDPGLGPHLFHNQGPGADGQVTFRRADHLLPALPGVEMSGSIFADYDNDGDEDIFIYTDSVSFDPFVENSADGALDLLLKNLWVENGRRVRAGEPLFLEVAAAAGVDGAADPPLGELPGRRAKTAAWLDFDRDGCLDLFVGCWRPNGSTSLAARDLLYRNRCDGTFEDVTVASGLHDGSDALTLRSALATIAGHLDGDLWPDLYVAHVVFLDPAPFADDFLYRNRGLGVPGRAFEEISLTLPGIGDDNSAGMGIDIADIDLDGDWDFYISDLAIHREQEASAGNVLYLGRGDGTFTDNAAAEAGVFGTHSWGVNFFDADHDGFEDLYITVLDFPGVALEEHFYRNHGDGTFTDVGATAGLRTYDSRGSAVADYDRDGDLDLAVVNQLQAGRLPGVLQLFRNDTAQAGHWLQVRLVGRESNRDAIGAVVVATTAGVRRMRQIEGGSSAHSQDSLVVHFGLGEAARVDELEVLWPSGRRTRLHDVEVDQRLEVVELRRFCPEPPAGLGVPRSACGGR